MKWAALVIALAALGLSIWTRVDVDAMTERVDQAERSAAVMRSIDGSLGRIATMIESFGERLTRLEAWRSGVPVK